MATTSLFPLHAGKGRTVGNAISDIIDYVKNPDKTDNGRLIGGSNFATGCGECIITIRRHIMD